MACIQQRLSGRARCGSLDNCLLRGPLAELAIDDFFLAANRELFALMLEFSEEGLPLDIIALVATLQQRTRLGAIGGVEYLDILSDGVVLHSGLIKRHADTVIRLSRLRQIEKLADDVSRRTREPGRRIPTFYWKRSRKRLAIYRLDTTQTAIFCPMSHACCRDVLRFSRFLRWKRRK